jgi:hypothetical protein
MTRTQLIKYCIPCFTFIALLNQVYHSSRVPQHTLRPEASIDANRIAQAVGTPLSEPTTTASIGTTIPEGDVKSEDVTTTLKELPLQETATLRILEVLSSTVEVAYIEPLQDDEHESWKNVKLVIYMTTHLTAVHLSFLPCWTHAIRRLKIFRYADLILYATSVPSEKQLAQLPFRKVTVKLYTNTGYQSGAIQAMIDPFVNNVTWFNGYDWVIRLNMDVLIRFDTWLIRTMLNSSINGIFHDCLNPPSYVLNPALHTDFYAFRPSAVDREMLLRSNDIIAEDHLAASFRNIYDSKQFAYIPGAANTMYGHCRFVGVNSPVIHDHEVAASCPHYYDVVVDGLHYIWNNTKLNKIEVSTMLEAGRNNNRPLEHVEKEKWSHVKLLIYMTTHYPKEHIAFLPCWNDAIKRLEIFKYADLILYTTSVPSEEELAQLPFRNVTIKLYNNTGYQAGAIQAMIDPFVENVTWFDVYDWVIRVNMDVLIRKDTWIIRTMLDATMNGIFHDCHYLPNYNVRRHLHTDFYAFRPSAVDREMVLRSNDNVAEDHLASSLKNIIDSRKFAYLRGAQNPIWGDCRIVGSDSPVVHSHNIAASCPYYYDVIVEGTLY